MQDGARRSMLQRVWSWRPRRRAWVVAGVGLAALLAALAASLGRLAPSPPTFATATVVRGTVTSSITATATVEPMDQVEVGSQVSGTLSEVRVDFNATVTRGQVLAVIEPSSFKARVVQQRAAVARAVAAARKAARELERARELFAEQLSSRADLDAAEATSEQADADLQQAKAVLEVADLDLAHTVIRSPIDGVVISRSVETGQTVAASLQAPQLFVIARDLSRMRLETNVDEADVGSVRPGLAATFTVDAYPARSFGGTVSQVRLEPTSNAGVVSYTTILHTENRDLALLPGMTADVTIELGRRTRVLVVPNAALRFHPSFLPPQRADSLADESRPAGAPGAAADRVAVAAAGAEPVAWDEIAADATRDTVYVVRADGPPRAVSVTLGLTDGDVTEVVAGGLHEGDKVITGEDVTGAAAARPSSGLAGLFRPPGAPRGGRAPR